MKKSSRNSVSVSYFMSRRRCHCTFVVLHVMLSLIMILSCFGAQSLHIGSSSSSNGGGGGGGITIRRSSEEEIINIVGRRVQGMMYGPTGSSLPDCSHACGGCFPCKRVTVSFKCSVESCPVVYRCTCNGKYYHVPSL